MKNKILFFGAVILIMGAVISCEQVEVFPEELSGVSAKNVRMDDEVSNLIDRSFVFNIEGEGEVDIINSNPGYEGTIHLSKGSCPYKYKLLVDESVVPGDFLGVQIIATVPPGRLVGFKEGEVEPCYTTDGQYSLTMTASSPSSVTAVFLDRFFDFFIDTGNATSDFSITVSGSTNAGAFTRSIGGSELITGVTSKSNITVSVHNFSSRKQVLSISGSSIYESVSIYPRETKDFVVSTDNNIYRLSVSLSVSTPWYSMPLPAVEAVQDSIR